MTILSELKTTMDVADLEETMKTLTCFKAYDIRGRLGSELNEDIAYRIG